VTGSVNSSLLLKIAFVVVFALSRVLIGKTGFVKIDLRRLFKRVSRILTFYEL